MKKAKPVFHWFLEGWDTTDLKFSKPPRLVVIYEDDSSEIFKRATPEFYVKKLDKLIKSGIEHSNLSIDTLLAFKKQFQDFIIFQNNKQNHEPKRKTS